MEISKPFICVNFPSILFFALLNIDFDSCVRLPGFILIWSHFYSLHIMVSTLKPYTLSMCTGRSAEGELRGGDKSGRQKLLGEGVATR